MTVSNNMWLVHCGFDYPVALVETKKEADRVLISLMLDMVEEFKLTPSAAFYDACVAGDIEYAFNLYYMVDPHSALDVCELTLLKKKIPALPSIEEIAMRMLKTVKLG